MISSLSLKHMTEALSSSSARTDDWLLFCTALEPDVVLCCEDEEDDKDKELSDEDGADDEGRERGREGPAVGRVDVGEAADSIARTVPRPLSLLAAIAEAEEEADDDEEEGEGIGKGN